jgi:hypothetical protein
MNSVQSNITSTATPRESSRVAQWAQENPAAFAWVTDNADTNSFAGSLMASLYKWGQLTPKQLTAVMGAIARAKIMQDKKDNAPVVSLDPVEDAFKRASSAGVNRPKLRLGEFVFSPAPATGKNPGAIYIKHGNGEYLGKVLGGKLFTVAAVSTALEQDIVAVAADPLNAAIAYGKKYGKCSVCGRTLTDEDSVGRGIGPVCAANYGWGV